MKPGASWPLWLAALLGLVFGIAAWAPATLVASAAARLSGQRLLLADAQGDWRDGSAEILLAGGAGSAGSTLAPGRIGWTLGLSGVWHGDIDLTLRSGSGAPLRLALHGGLTGWSARQAAPASWSTRMPADMLQGLGTPWNTLAPRGLLTLTLEQASLRRTAGRMRVGGRVELLASDMSSRLSQIAPLGSYRITIAGTAGGASLALTTLDGPLRLAGSGGWSGARFHFQGRASAAPGHAQGLAGLLGLIGQPDGDHVRIAI